MTVLLAETDGVAGVKKKVFLTSLEKKYRGKIHFMDWDEIITIIIWKARAGVLHAVCFIYTTL